MKTLIISLVALLAIGTTSCKEDTPVIPVIDELTAQEQSDLLFLREEEKLARDVYLYASDLYNQQIFSNIAASEQKHMDKVLDLLNAYNLEDPVADDTRGVFKNQEIKSLYISLTAMVDLSYVDALKAGATIEDLDINDLDELIKVTVKEDIKETAEVLRCASGNHMQAFSGKLDNEGVTYVPQYISQETYEAVLAAPHGHCGG